MKPARKILQFPRRMADRKRSQAKHSRAKALIRPFEYTDKITGDKISISVSRYYSKLTVNRREYYFVRSTGVFDGAATIEHTGPILIYDSDRE
jgi:hypothetical protein